MAYMYCRKINLDCDSSRFALGPGQHVLVPPMVRRRLAGEEQGLYIMLRFQSVCIDVMPGPCGLPFCHPSTRMTYVNYEILPLANDQVLVEVLLLRLLMAAQNQAVQADEAALHDPVSAEDTLVRAQRYIAISPIISNAKILLVPATVLRRNRRLCQAQRGCTPLVYSPKSACNKLGDSSREIVAALLLLPQLLAMPVSHFGHVFKRENGMTPQNAVTGQDKPGGISNQTMVGRCISCNGSLHSLMMKFS